MAQDNKGRPGMPPSPNQQIVLDALKSLWTIVERQTPNSPGVSIDFLARYMDANHLGGMTVTYPSTGRTVWGSWSRNTVRDHLNALTHRGHVTKRIVKSAYFKPKD